jgi:carboxyl-terminal processing protease
VAFKTRNGRVVYDGGGITPDVPVEHPTFPAIAQSLDSKGLLFEYANKYANEHQTIKPAKDFQLGDEEYQAFVNWLSTKEYDYTTQVEKSVEDLITYAKKEKYYEDIQDQIKSLKTKMYHNKDSDLQKFKTEIKEMLEQEIVSRYYLQKGFVEASFDDDVDIRAAVDVLNNNGRYGQLLKGK